MIRGNHPRWLWFSFFGAATLYAVPGLVLYVMFRQPSFDLGIYEQTIWLLTRGADFNTVGGNHVFGGHFSPILYLLTPLTLLPGGAVPELMFQGLWMATAVFPLYRIAMLLGRSPGPLVLFGAIHPGVFAAAWWGMRPWNLSYPLLLWAAYAVLRRPHWMVVAAAGLVGLTFREDLGVWVGVFTLILALARRISWAHVVKGGIPIAIATGFLIFGLLPRWSAADSLLYEASLTGGSAQTLAQLVFTAARVAFLLLPLALASHLARTLNWRLTLPLLVPILGLALRGGNALSTTFHYDLLLVGALALIVALSPEIHLSLPHIVVGSLLAGIALGPLNPFTPHLGPNLTGISVDHASDHAGLARALDRFDDGDMSMALPDPLVAHFAARKQVFSFPYPFDQPRAEPLAMSCPKPQLVAVDHFLPADGPGWEKSAPHYVERWSNHRFSILIHATPATEGECVPAPQPTEHP